MDFWILLVSFVMLDFMGVLFYNISYGDLGNP